MSDLLPLVAAILKDKAALDASEEIATLRNERDASRRVEILHAREGDIGEVEGEGDEVTVYGSARFEDGNYGRNTNLWTVLLESTATCRLADLTSCQVCVGGGFPVATLAEARNFQGWLHNPVDDEYVGRPAEDAVGVHFCFSPYCVWLSIWIRGWPREDWEAKILADDLDHNEMTAFLIEEVAPQYPDATVEFKDVSFVAQHIHGALKRLLSPRRRAEVRADRDARNETIDPQFTQLYEFVTRTMRLRGNTAGPELFLPQANEVMGILHQMGVTNAESSEARDALIVQVVSLYEQHGGDALRIAVEGSFNQINQREGEGEGEDNTEPE